ncbi:MAG: DUF1318 domain-containing protein [Verrucomicrobia bacterium]|nr:MAG: DUF1318 domain-containing protein [Verrucomicrobiota bacterium]
MMNATTFRLSLVLVMLGSLFLAPRHGAAAEEDAIKQRMLERVAQIDEMKAAGLVGENNKGFLEQRGQLTPEQTALLKAENADRRELYGILARRLGLTAAVVGESRAESLRKKSAPGVWLQAPDGSWYRK